MSQHVITLIKFANISGIDEIINQWKTGKLTLEFDQRLSPWLLYYSQWYDPWLSGMEYTKGALENCGLIVKEITEVNNNIDIIEVNCMGIRVDNSGFEREESRWLYDEIIKADKAFGKIWNDCRMMLKVEVFGTSVDDVELIGLIKSANQSLKGRM